MKGSDCKCHSTIRRHIRDQIFLFRKSCYGRLVINWSRAKREALIRGDYEAPPLLARKDFEKYRSHAVDPTLPHSD